jgi:hypothetical protein
MDFLNSFTAKDILTALIGVGMAWMFIKMSIKSLDQRVTKVEKDNEMIRSDQADLKTQLAVILEQTKNTNEKITDLTKYVHSKI